MNILILGSGGREHTFAWKIAQSPQINQLFVAPGNAGTARIAQNVPIGVNDFEKIADFALKNQIDLILVGPEEPLVRGIRNYFAENTTLSHIHIIGPDKRGAMLEGSKDFSKNFMHQYGIPTAKAQSFTKTNIEEGLKYLETHSLPIVLKADGLAAGKGVIITDDLQEAKNTLNEMLLQNKFGEASNKVLVEEFLQGIEVSVFVLTDGKNYLILPEAKDYKRIGEKDTGLNTGGMGAVSPVPFANTSFLEKVEKQIIQPTMHGLQEEGIDYIGFLFLGLMNVAGNPYMIEYNARMGDPETEVVIPRIKNDWVEILKATAEKRLNEIALQIDERYATTIMLVSGGYPEEYEKGKKITHPELIEDSIIFHAGTKLNEAQEVMTDGGRVMAVTSFGSSIEEALAKSNLTASKIEFEKKYYRKDIGLDLI